MTTRFDAEQILVDNNLNHIELIEYQAFSRPGTFKCHKCNNIFHRAQMGDTIKKGCPNCDYPLPKNIMTLEQMQEQIHSKNPNITLIEFLNTRSPVRLYYLEKSLRYHINPSSNISSSSLS